MKTGQEEYWTTRSPLLTGFGHMITVWRQEPVRVTIDSRWSGGLSNLIGCVNLESFKLFTGWLPKYGECWHIKGCTRTRLYPLMPEEQKNADEKVANHV